MPFPTAEELEREYGHLLDDPVFRALENWRESHHDEPLDEGACLARVERTGPAWMAKIEEALDSIAAAGREG